MEDKSWTLHHPQVGQELVTARMATEVFAQRSVDLLVHRRRVLDHGTNVQRGRSRVANLGGQAYAREFGRESRCPVFATFITQSAKLDETRPQRLSNPSGAVSTNSSCPRLSARTAGRQDM
jgi:hypothetical protein